MSHGEGFLAMFGAVFRDPGFYVMDEPESALLFTACLQLVALMHELGQSGGARPAAYEVDGATAGRPLAALSRQPGDLT
jgi:hypothetical protein